MPSDLQRKTSHKAIVYLLVTAIVTVGNTGCSRRFWRQQAERDTYNAIGEKLNDRRWQLPRVDIKPNRRSRFFDPYDPDCEPLPPDDPAAHHYMHCVNGKRGYKSWHKLGTALSIENPQWLEPYGVFMQNTDPVHGHSQVSLPRIKLEDAVDLSYIHSREYQTAIENLYLDALNLTLERFNLGVRYGGNGLAPPGFGLDYTDNAAGPDTYGASPSFGVRQLLPSGAQLAVELANSTLWLFGSGTDRSATTLSYALTQPLLRGAGRKIILEGLTQSERDVLYEARTLARFRQTLFSSTASDYLQILLQSQNILNIEFNIRQLQEQIEVATVEESRVPTLVRGELSEWPADVEIPADLTPFLSYDEVGQFLNWQGPLTEELEQALMQVSDDTQYQAAAQEIVRWKRTEVVPLRVAELATQLNNSRSQLQDARRALADRLDSFKITLGLPPDVQLTIDDALLIPFQLISPELLGAETGFKDLAKQQGISLIPDSGDGTAAQPKTLDLTDLKSYAGNLAALQTELGQVVGQVEADFLPIQSILELTAEDWSASRTGDRYFNAAEERERVIKDVAQDLRLFRSNETDFEHFSQLLTVVLQTLEGDDPLMRLDTNNDQQIDYSELPEQWFELPDIKRSIAAASETDALPGELSITSDVPDTQDIKLSYEQFLLVSRDALMSLREEMLQIAQGLQVVQAGLRVEAIAINRFTLPGQDQFPEIEEVTRIALEQRHDLMNARAAVMDARRAVEIAANALESTLDLTVSGSVGGVGANRKPFDFDSRASSVNVGLDFDTPVDKLSERNAYNRAQVEYQRERRAYMQLEDQIKQQVRQSWRQLQVSEQQLEIDRQAVRIAASQYDSAALQAQGTRQSNSLSILNALSSVLRAQNALANDWITYERNRLNIYRDMGIMEIDPRGLWTDPFYQNGDEQPPQPALTPDGLITPDQMPPEVPTNE